MNRSEETVRDLLESMGFSNIVYEPDGNIPPDFLVDGRIAVEVRRLNQNHDTGLGMQGLESVEIQLWDRLEKLVQSLHDGQPVSESWFVDITFRRPIPSWKQLKPQIRAALVAFQKQSVRVSGELFLDKNLQIDLIKASKPQGTYFCMGMSSDMQAGGFVISEMIENCQFCMSEKAGKVAKYRDKYPEWWLVLTDHIGLGLKPVDQAQFLDSIERIGDWDKVIIVSPIDHASWFEF